MKNSVRSHRDVEVDILINQHPATRKDIKLFGLRVLAYTVSQDGARKVHTSLEVTLCNSVEFADKEQNLQTVLFESFSQTDLLSCAFDLVEHNSESVFGLKGECLKYFDIKSLNKVVVFGNVEFLQEQKKTIVLKKCLAEIMDLFDLGNAFIFHPVSLSVVDKSGSGFERLDDYNSEPDTFEGAGFVYNDKQSKASMVYRPSDERSLLGRKEKIGRSKSFSM